MASEDDDWHHEGWLQSLKHEIFVQVIFLLIPLPTYDTLADSYAKITWLFLETQVGEFRTGDY